MNKFEFLFDCYDTDKDGFLTRENFYLFLYELGKQETIQDQFDACFDFMNSTKSGKLNFEEFSQNLPELYQVKLIPKNVEDNPSINPKSSPHFHIFEKSIQDSAEASSKESTMKRSGSSNPSSPLQESISSRHVEYDRQVKLSTTKDESKVTVGKSKESLKSTEDFKAEKVSVSKTGPQGSVEEMAGKQVTEVTGPTKQSPISGFIAKNEQESAAGASIENEKFQESLPVQISIEDVIEKKLAAETAPQSSTGSQPKDEVQIQKSDEALDGKQVTEAMNLEKQRPIEGSIEKEEREPTAGASNQRFIEAVVEKEEYISAQGVKEVDKKEEVSNDVQQIPTVEESEHENDKRKPLRTSNAGASELTRTKSMARPSSVAAKQLGKTASNPPAVGLTRAASTRRPGAAGTGGLQRQISTRKPSVTAATTGVGYSAVKASVSPASVNVIPKDGDWMAKLKEQQQGSKTTSEQDETVPQWVQQLKNK